MTDKKKLPDETLKDVSGGAFVEISPGLDRFTGNNCISCSNNLPGRGCPYGSSVYAFKELGRDGICPKKEAM